jgi:succinate dehydrogenase / fumarate reductase, membrane anchor subunit
MSLRTPLARVLNHGAAGDGVGHWWQQRVSALALAPLSLWLTLALLPLATRDYVSVTTWIGSGVHPILLCLTVLLAFWHAWLGLQVVIEDYVPHAALKTTLLLLCGFAAGLLAFSGVYAVLRIALRPLI